MHGAFTLCFLMQAAILVLPILLANILWELNIQRTCTITAQPLFSKLQKNSYYIQNCTCVERIAYNRVPYLD